MKKILITGSSGFLGSSIFKTFLDKNEYLIYPFSHTSLDLTNIKQLERVLSYIRPDFVINCAYNGGRRIKEDTIKDFDDNCRMVENLINCKQYYGKLFLFSSGAVYDRRFSINNKKELNRLDKSYIPNDFYGRAKFFNDLEAVKNKEVINLRLFNVFGNGMIDSAIPTFINNCLQNKPLNIWSDYKFDTFWVQDLIKIIEYFIENPPNKYYEINCVYSGKKYYLSEVAQKIKLLTNSKSDIIIEEKSKKHYTGNRDRLKELGIKLSGLEFGLKDCIEYFKNGQKTN